MLAVTSMSISNAMWRMQQALHQKNNSIVPGVLLAVSVLLVVCHLIISQHPSNQHEHTDGITQFLFLIVIQMLPLIFLEVKIMSCADPVGLFCQFAVPVTLSHAIFLAMRLLHWGSYQMPIAIGSLVGLAAAIYTMVKGYHWSPVALFHHKAVWGLVACAIGGAWFSRSIMLFAFHHPEDGMDDDAKDRGLFMALHDIFHAILQPCFLDWDDFQMYLLMVFETANGYMEVLAFVPAVWMVAREGQKARRFEIEELDTKRTCTAFFLFLVGFYICEDGYNAIQVWRISACACVAHIAHYLLLLDFACYILAHIYNPEKLMGELRKWLPVDLSYDV